MLEDLPKASGLHEVNTLLSMTREDDDTADRWAQRYHVGRRVIGKRMGTNLSDAIYVELCLRGLREGEIADMVRALMAQNRANRARPRPLGGGAPQPEMTPAKALSVLKCMTWDAFRKHIKASVEKHAPYKQGDVTIPPPRRKGLQLLPGYPYATSQKEAEG